MGHEHKAEVTYAWVNNHGSKKYDSGSGVKPSVDFLTPLSAFVVAFTRNTNGLQLQAIYNAVL